MDNEMEATIRLQPFLRSLHQHTGGFPKLGVPFWGSSRIIVFGGLYWDPPTLGNHHIGILLVKTLNPSLQFACYFPLPL